MFASNRTHTNLITAAFSMVIAVAGLTSNASADIYHHLDQVAVRIQSQAARLVKETRHYRHDPRYRHLLSDARQLCALAAHIHNVTHFEGNLRHLSNDVDQLDQVFHHLEGMFDHIEREAARGRGRVYGNTRHVKKLLNQIEDEIHCLQDDLAEIRRIKRRARAQAQAWGTGYVPRYGTGYYGHSSRGQNIQHQNLYGGPARAPQRTARGFAIGGGSSKIWLSF